MYISPWNYLLALGSGDSSSNVFPPIQYESEAGYNFVDLANKAVAYAILLAGLLSVIFMFVGGISFILSGGKEEKVRQAISTIRYALLGLVITILSITVITLVGRIFGLELVNYLSFENIISTVNSFFGGNG